MSRRTPNLDLLAFAQGRTAKAKPHRIPEIRIRVSVPTEVPSIVRPGHAKASAAYDNRLTGLDPAVRDALSFEGPQGSVRGRLLELVRVSGGYVVTIDACEGPLNFLLHQDQARRLGLVGQPRSQIGMQADKETSPMAVVIHVVFQRHGNPVEAAA